jgi:hypothetical protein
MLYLVAIRTALAVSLAIAVATAARAQERLVLAPYPGGTPWRLVTDKAIGARFMREQIPADQTPEDFRDILTAQSFPQYQGSPAGFLSGVFASAQKDCDALAVNGPKTLEEHGHLVAYAQVYCGRRKGKTYGMHMFFKAIQGADALYVVNRDFRTPPSDYPGTLTFPKGQEAQAIGFLKAEGEANRYLEDSVYLCAPQSTGSGCAAQTAK